jgi:DMSO/TMAO reductase YedYZ molybdopterin-dependent catalytic subunit
MTLIVKSKIQARNVIGESRVLSAINNGISLTRRQWLSTAFLSSCALALVGLESCRESGPPENTNSTSGGKQIGTVDFAGEGQTPMNSPVGAELDGRLFTDLSEANPDEKVTPIEKFYIRTRASNLLDPRNPWYVQLGPGLNHPRLSAVEVSKRSVPIGVNLMECSGNVHASHFGMLSVADWAGLPLSVLLDRIPRNKRKSSVLISGFDKYENGSATSIEGASWIFPIDDLLSSNAFLATTMNGEPLTRDHGAPVRLVVPGWYGCACIKWVNDIRLIDETAEATSQMQEYATRTHQSGIPKLAAGYQPATIDAAAMPIRIEKWLVERQIRYRIVGIHWGGSVPIRTLEIQFRPGEKFFRVDDLREKTGNTWGFWTYIWTPTDLGNYEIRMRVSEPALRTRRLDIGYYVRTVKITQV